MGTINAPESIHPNVPNGKNSRFFTFWKNFSFLQINTKMFQFDFQEFPEFQIFFSKLILKKFSLEIYKFQLQNCIN